MTDRLPAGFDCILDGVRDILIAGEIGPGDFVHALFMHVYQPDKCLGITLLCFFDKIFQRDPLLSFCRVHRR